MAEKAVRLSLTLSKPLHELTDAVLTPKGFMKPSKGAYSSLLEKLVTEFLEENLGADIFDIMDYAAVNPIDVDAMREHFKAAK